LCLKLRRRGRWSSPVARRRRGWCARRGPLKSAEALDVEGAEARRWWLVGDEERRWLVEGGRDAAAARRRRGWWRCSGGVVDEETPGLLVEDGGARRLQGWANGNC